MKEYYNRPSGVPGYLACWASVEKMKKGKYIVHVKEDMQQNGYTIETLNSRKDALAFIRECWRCDRLIRDREAESILNNN